ncbi:hypothetical protein LCGC14_1924360 [marine sediment metagenome]|uniref:Uncharacterized protein n=1 Tax=marine sediment metagenome TaxID=412755 RepID=A0A0F9FQH1_9ZZZZ
MIEHQGPADYDAVVCPHGCPADTKITEGFYSTTLLGWSGGPDRDPNHRKFDGTCKGCGQSFIKHWVVRDRNAWYTDETGHVLMGHATCCMEVYARPCTIDGCVGFQRYATRGAMSFRIEDGKSVPNHPVYWTCDTCAGRFPDDHWGEEYMPGVGRFE